MTSFAQSLDQLLQPLRLPFPDNYFDVLDVDNPWEYRDRGMNGFQDVQEYRVHPSYITQSMDWIIESTKEIRRVMKPEFSAWVWWTKDFKREALLYMDALGVVEKQIVPWIKTTQDGVPIAGGLGRYYGRNAVEFLSYSVTNTSIHWLNGTQEPNYILAPKKKNWKGRYHSRKPDEAYEFIKRNNDGKRLSLFQIDPRDGFICFGSDLPPEYQLWLVEQFGDWREPPVKQNLTPDPFIPSGRQLLLPGVAV